uniref:Uncharacterized protein n=1 Tax=Romanomermis culicivorax TaxID=13658 RepID=A0A915HGI7_ROMCU
MFPSTAVEGKSLLDDEIGFAKLPTAEKLGMLGVDQDALKDPMALTSSMQDSLSFIMQSLNDSFLSEIGEQRKSLIFDCLFDRHSCNNDKDIIRIRNSVYGNCFSFNNNNATLPKYTISAGMENGLKMIMHIDQTDYNCNVEQAGIRMIIHDQDVQPTPEMDGYYIETGVVTYFNIIQ